jgi:hypothetical protein
MATSVPSLRDFLNRLPIDDANKLLQAFKESRGVERKCYIDYGKTEYNEESFNEAVALTDNEHSGEWWISKCTCEIVPGGTRESLRWQINGPGRSTGTSLTTPPKGKQAGIHNISRLLKGEARDSLRRICDAAGGDKPNVKLWAHHLAYLVGPFRKPDGLPENLGSGEAVSHLCDKCCVSPYHNMHESQKGNMSRVNCPGTTIMVKDGVIIAELPCIHGQASDGTTDWNLVCSRARIWETDTVSVSSKYRQVFDLKAAFYKDAFAFTAE